MADDKNSNSGNSQSQGQSQNTTPSEAPKVDQGLVEVSQMGEGVDPNLVDIIQKSEK
jgi:hypothetical protein